MTTNDIILHKGKHYLTPTQLATLLGLTRQAVNYHIHAGHIRTLRVELSAIKSYRLIPHEEIEKIKKWLYKPRSKNQDKNKSE